jgi:hypothetical protein
MDIINQRGITGLWAGLTPAYVHLWCFKYNGLALSTAGLTRGSFLSYFSLILVSNPVIQYVLFERLKVVLLKKKKDLTSLDFFLLGAFTKLIASFVVRSPTIANVSLPSV